MTIGVVFLMLAIMYLTSWKKKNIPVKVLVKAVITQFLIAVILVKVPADRCVVSKVSGAATNVINCEQDGLSFVFGSPADSTAAAGSVFAMQVLGSIMFLPALVSFLYYIGVSGFVVKWVDKAAGKLMNTSEVESFTAVANMFLGQTDSPMPVGNIMVAKMPLSQTEEIQKAGNIKMDNKRNNTSIIEAVVEGAVTGMQMALSIGTSPMAMMALVAAMNKLLGVCGIGFQQVLSYVFAPFDSFLGLDPSEILLEGNLLGSKLIPNEFMAFQQPDGMISSMDYRTGMIFAISLRNFANFSSLGICVSGVVVLCPEEKSTLAHLVFRAMLGDVAASLISVMTVSLVTLC